MVHVWSSSQGARPQIRGSQRPVPKFQPGASWGEGTKAGRGAAPAGQGLEALEAHLMAAPQAGGAPTGRGAPGSRFRGSGLAPGSAQSPPGSRPIESGFLGKTWTGPGRVLGHLHPLGVRSGSPRQKGGATSPPRRSPSAAGGYSVTLTTVLLSAASRSKIPLPVPTVPCALKGPRANQGGGGWGGGRLKGLRGTSHPNVTAWGCMPGSLSP